MWLLVDPDGTVEAELYVESHEYRGGDFDVHTATPESEWTHHGEFETQGEAFERALDVVDARPRPPSERLEIPARTQ